MPSLDAMPPISPEISPPGRNASINAPTITPFITDWYSSALPTSMIFLSWRAMPMPNTIPETASIIETVPRAMPYPEKATQSTPKIYDDTFSTVILVSRWLDAEAKAVDATLSIATTMAPIIMFIEVVWKLAFLSGGSICPIA